MEVQCFLQNILGAKQNFILSMHFKRHSYTPLKITSTVCLVLYRKLPSTTECLLLFGKVGPADAVIANILIKCSDQNKTAAHKQWKDF